MFKKIILIFIISLFSFTLFIPTIKATGLKAAPKITTNVANGGGYDTKSGADINTIVAQVIKAFLMLLGTIFLALMVYGGYLWMTDMGNSDKVDKAKGLISAAIIGLIITLASYAISYFVLETFTDKTLAPEEIPVNVN